MTSQREIAKVIEKAIEVPPHIQHAADACLFDLVNGPCWSRIPGGDITRFTDPDLYSSLRADLEDDMESGDTLTETYTGPVGDAVRAFLDDLPSKAWVDMECGFYMDTEPQTAFIPDEAGPDEVDGVQGWLDEPNWASIYLVDHCQIIAALFGKIFAREFR